LIDSIRSAEETCAEKYPGSQAIKAELKTTKGGKISFIINVKVNEENMVKVLVAADGKAKIDDKNGELKPIKKGGGKKDAADGDAPKKGKGKDKGKSKGKKKAAEEDEEME